MTYNAPPPTATQIQHVKPPWKLKGTVYSFPVYTFTSKIPTLSKHHSFLYAPLESSSPFSTGKFVGGLGMVQIIRYTSSPVGPYDELLVVPGYFEYERDREDGKGGVRVEKKKNARITRIYVSQKETCWNGRANWNIPKHLAKFTFSTLANGSTTITVNPLSTSPIAPKPFFTANFRKTPYLPGFPLSTSIGKWVGIDMDLVQPPLPEGKGEEEVGTERWCGIVPFQSGRTAVGWWDMEGESVEEGEGGDGEEADGVSGIAKSGKAVGKEVHENWWPGGGKWRIGMVMEDADIAFPEGKYWNRSSL